MALVEYKLMYGATYATMTETATNLQSVTLNMGRHRQLDQYSANTGSVSLRYPTGYASPNPYWVTGTWVSVLIRLGSGSFGTFFIGKITDANVSYGIRNGIVKVEAWKRWFTILNRLKVMSLA